MTTWLLSIVSNQPHLLEALFESPATVGACQQQCRWAPGVGELLWLGSY